MTRVLAALIVAAVALAAPARSTSARQEQVPERSVVIAVISADEIYVGKDRTPASDVAGLVAQRLGELPAKDRIVYIKSKPDVDYGSVVQLIDALRERGITRIGLIADKPAQDAEPDASDAPRAGHDEGLAPQESVVVEVTLDRRRRVSYVIDGRRVSSRMLTTSLRERLSQATGKTVIILAPKSLPYREVVRVIDSAKDAGATNIGLEQDYVP